MIKGLKLIIALLIAMSLVGCVSLKVPKSSTQQFQTVSAKKRQRHLKQIKRFIANGAFSIQETSEQPVLANYQWTQKTIRFYRIRIFSPLNLFNVTILGHLGSVTLWKSTKQRATAKTPEQLLRNELGWSIPIRNLFYWIRGVIAPGKNKATFDQFGHMVALRQDGWMIQLSHYGNVDGYDLPKKLLLSRPDIRVTLVVKRWQLAHKK